MLDPASILSFLNLLGSSRNAVATRKITGGKWIYSTVKALVKKKQTVT